MCIERFDNLQTRNIITVIAVTSLDYLPNQMRINTSCSFVNFVYPFAFNPEAFSDLSKAIESAYLHRDENRSPLKIWHTTSFSEDDLMPHIAAYLNGIDTLGRETARLWNLNDALQHVYGLGKHADWIIQWPTGKLPFQFGESSFSAQIVLFRVGVGFLTLRIKPVSENVDDWLDAVHYLRFIDGQRGVSVAKYVKRPNKAKGIDNEMQISLDSQSKSTITLYSIVCDLMSFHKLETKNSAWWEEVFVPRQTIPYCALFVEGITEAAESDLRYRILNLFHSKQQTHPSEDDLKFPGSGLLPYAKGQHFMCTLDGSSFLACNPPSTPFFQETLPNHLRESYWLLYLLVLHQRFTLIQLSKAVAEKWQPDKGLVNIKEREMVFSQIRDTLLLFTARGYFAQVMQREHHHRCYKHWQSVFQIERLYREVRDEVSDMHDYLMAESSKHLEEIAESQRSQFELATRTEEYRERKLNRIAWILGVPIGLLSYVGSAASLMSANVGIVASWLLPIATLLIGTAIALAMYRFVTRH